MEHWVGWLKPHEQAALQQSEEWLHRPANAWTKVMRFVEQPLEKAYERVPDHLKESMGRAVFGVLQRAMGTSELTVPERALLDRLSEEAGFEVQDLRHVRRVDIRVLDRVAHRSSLFHRRAAAAEGGATGLAGLPGLLLDVPALYCLIFRMIQEISLGYGFPVHTEEEKTHILKVLDVGHRIDPEERRQGMREIQAVQEMLHSGVPVREIEKQVIVRGLQALAEKLGIGLTERKLAQTIAVVGALVGAGVNWQLLTDIGDTAYHSYRRRFLMEVARGRQDRSTRPLA